MEFKVTREKIHQQATSTEPNKYKLEVKATGNKYDIANYAHHCGNWSPNKEVATEGCSSKCDLYIDDFICTEHYRKSGYCPR